MDRDSQKRLFNRCRPDEPLSPTDNRWVDLDAQGARGVRWDDVLAAPIELSTRSTCQLLTAVPGAGISTELRRLGARLADEKGAHLLVVHVDADQVLAPAAPIDVAALLVAVVGATQEAAATAGVGGAAETVARFQRWLPRLPASEGGDERPTWSRLLAELRDVAPARARLHAETSAEFSRFVREVRTSLDAAQSGVRAHGYGGVAVLFDGLEKLRGMTGERARILASAEKVFGADGEYLELPVHTIFTIPPALVLRLRAPVHLLPALRIADRRGRADVGVETAREVVRRRVPDEALDALLGPRDREARVARMIAESGGLVRDLVKLLHGAVVRPVGDDDAFAQLLGSLGEVRGRLLTESSYEWLARVPADKALPAYDAAHAEAADDALGLGAALPYRDAEGDWFDVAPPVQSMRRMAEAIGQARSAA